MVKMIDEDDDEVVVPSKRAAAAKKQQYIDDDDDESVQSIKSDEDENDGKKSKKKKVAATPKTETKTKSPKTATPKTKEIVEEKEDIKQSSSSSSSSIIKSEPTSKVSSLDELTKGGALATEQAVKKVLLPYMKRENRPFNAGQLHENFHKRMPKSVLEKALTTLSESGNGVRCKEYGKSKIFFADQSTIPCGSEKEIKELNVDIEKLKRQYDTISHELGNTKAECIKIENDPIDSSLSQFLSDLETKIAEKSSRVNLINECSSTLEPFALSNAVKEHNYYRTMWVTRKRSCMELVDGLLENNGKKKAAFVSEIGIETDEEMNTPLPPILPDVKNNFKK